MIRPTADLLFQVREVYIEIESTSTYLIKCYFISNVHTLDFPWLTNVIQIHTITLTDKTSKCSLLDLCIYFIDINIVITNITVLHKLVEIDGLLIATIN